MILNRFGSAPSSKAALWNQAGSGSGSFSNNGNLFKSYKSMRESKKSIEPLPDSLLRKSLKLEGLSTAAAASDMSPWQSYDKVVEPVSASSKRRKSLPNRRHVKSKMKNNVIQTERIFSEEIDRIQFIENMGKAPQLKLIIHLIRRQTYGGSSYSALEDGVAKFSIDLSEFINAKGNVELLNENSKGPGDKPIFRFEQGVDFDFAALETLIVNFITSQVGWEYDVRIKFELQGTKVTVNRATPNRFRIRKLLPRYIFPWSQGGRTKVPGYISQHKLNITPLQIFYHLSNPIKQQVLQSAGIAVC